MPEIDIGDDVFVYRDSTSQMWRVQVKTSSAVVQANSEKFQFRIREAQITTPANPQLHFVFAMRTGPTWKFLVVERGILHNYRQQNATFGTVHTKNGVNWVNLNISVWTTGIHAGQVRCSGVNLAHHLNDWDNAWPAI
jgi:hypothetical protein